MNPVDAAIAGGMLRGMAEYAFPVILGRDFAGVVEDTGEEVFGFVPHAAPDVAAGAWAERIALSPYFAPKPASLSMAEAGAAPLAGITALLCVEALELTGRRARADRRRHRRRRLLRRPVRFAPRARPSSLPPCAEDRDYLEALGASEVPERGARPPPTRVIDLVSYSPDQLAANAPGLADGGKRVSALGAGEINVMAISDPEAPARLARTIDEHGDPGPDRALVRLRRPRRGARRARLAQARQGCPSSPDEGPRRSRVGAEQ